jgi:predicted PurR-regulated permease PerM
MSSPRVPALRVSLRSALAIVFAIAATVLVLSIARSAERVIVWALTAAAVAALVYPAVAFFDRWLPRALAVLLVFVVTVGAIGLAAARTVGDIERETRHLQRAAPARAAQLERQSDILRELHLRRRVATLVHEVPGRLSGRSAADTIRTAANRGLAILATTVLALFFVVYGPRIVDAAVDQVRDPDQRARVEGIVHHASSRALGYSRATIAKAVVEGLLAWGIATAAHVPGPAALAVWVALWSLVPVGGVLVGALPIVAFAGAVSRTTMVFVIVAFVVIAVVEGVFVEPRVERATMRLGSFTTLFVGFAGLELAGISGALLALLGAAIFVASLQQLGPDELVEVVASPAGGGDTAVVRGS